LKDAEKGKPERLNSINEETIKKLEGLLIDDLR
jgi:hypothetical protein